jgi:transporter family protein
MAITFMAERPSFLQWIGIGISLMSYGVMSAAGRKETGVYWKNPWILAMFFGTFLGSCSGVYDKFLLQKMHFDPLALQAWFSFYMVILQGLVLLFFWYPRRAKETSFHFRWVIVAVGVLLLVADRFYFLALHEEGALVSVVTVIRRSNVVISFAGGLVLFGEYRGKLKMLAIVGILLGLAFMGLG